jgi:hypothetical protein
MLARLQLASRVALDGADAGQAVFQANKALRRGQPRRSSSATATVTVAVTATATVTATVTFTVTFTVTATVTVTVTVTVTATVTVTVTVTVTATATVTVTRTLPAGEQCSGSAHQKFLSASRTVHLPSLGTPTSGSLLETKKDQGPGASRAVRAVGRPRQACRQSPATPRSGAAV